MTTPRITPALETPQTTLYAADCLEVMRQLPDQSVQCIVTDPPYFRVKADWWDRQWSTKDEFLSWIRQLSVEWKRLLKPNGSLYCFASPHHVWDVEGILRQQFSILNRIIWKKEDAQGGGRHRHTCKAELRRYFPQTEHLLFAEPFEVDRQAEDESSYRTHCNTLRSDLFEPIRQYLANEWERAGLTNQDANRATGTQMAGHWFGHSQWELPTPERYRALQDYAAQHGAKRRTLGKPYEELRTQYEELRRPFHVTPDRPYTDVWEYHTVPGRKGKHPCEKPLAMFCDIIETSTRQGDVVLDCFAGSGVTGLATQQLGRRAILCELDPHWCQQLTQTFQPATTQQQAA